MTDSRITYNLQGVVSNNIASATRYAIGKLGIPFVKNFLKFVPGVDASVDVDENPDDFYVEIVPSFLGFFTAHWEIRQHMVKRYKALGVRVRSVHAPYIDDGKVYQSYRQSTFDNTLDISCYDSKTWLCLYSHIDLYEELAPKEQEKVLILHPLPASPYKNRAEIVDGVVKNIRKILPALREHNITLVVENMPWLRGKHERYTTLLGDVSFFSELMDRLNDDHVGVLFDWGHANTFARYMFDHGIAHQEFEFSRESLSRFAYQEYFLKKLGNKVRYAHLNFNDAHCVDHKPSFFFKNFDTHADLTELSEEEYKNYKQNVQLLRNNPKLIGITIETIPSFFNRKKRISRYKGSVEILNSMLQSQD